MPKRPDNPAQPATDPQQLNPKETSEFMERGWLFYSHKNYESAEADFRFVLQREPTDVEALYALGLTLKALGKSQEAVAVFSQIDAALTAIEDHQRAVMLSRLAHGHLNQIKTGEWNLEKEVWKTKR
ncbi:MAG TPA: tetratricopeptide repeat protein [Anaerolineaceae bacterium]|nr:tetratricopeptide repeat protein [Anaerolineaceae bacterium]